MLTLADPLEAARRVHPRRTAVVDGEARFEYAQLAARCDRLAVGLRRLGVRQGDRVAILSANSHRYFEAFWGIPAHGMVIVPLNTRLAMPELQTIVEHAGARVLISDRDPGPLARCVERVVSIPDDYEALLETGGGAVDARIEETDIAAIFYTGGTTGTPKGVMLTHRNLVANAFHKALACSLTGDDVFLAAPAMFHVAGIAPLVALTWLGARCVTLPAFDPDACLDAIERHRVTVFMPVPTMLAALVAAQNARPREVSSLRMLGHAGSPIATETLVAAHAAFPDSELAQFYGATETASIVTCMRDEQAALFTPRLGSCGRAVPGVAVRIVRADGTECAAGEVGEILVRGPNVTAGYFRDPDATALAFHRGFYRTGDLGVLSEDGYLFVVDRIKDMIVSGGENVYSIEVEDALCRHPAVLEVAVFGIPHEVWGEAVHAVVVVKPEHARTPHAELADALKTHCRALIAGYKVPKTIELREQPLPKSGPGKVLKRVLRAPYLQKESG